MKRLALFICTLLCANVLSAQTEFGVGNLDYEVTSTNPPEVAVRDAFTMITTENIPETVTYQGTDYSVTSIGDNAFDGCYRLTSVTIPNSVTSIGDYAFDGCSSLTSVTIPNSVTSIGKSAFAYCSALTSVTIGNSVTSFGSSAFKGCSSLTSVTIPNSVTSIGYEAFRGCSSLTSIIIPNSVTSVGAAVFYNCSSLTSVTLSNNITKLPSVDAYGDDYYGFFENCNSLTSITIPNSVTSIGEQAFYGCSSLTSMTIEMSSIPSNLFIIDEDSTTPFPLQNLTLGENVTSIASGAFNDCSFLQNVTCLATTPPTLADNTVFPYPNIATLTVPCGSLEAYSAPTSFWNMFFVGRIEEDCEDNTGLEDAEETLLAFFPNPTKNEITFNQAIENVEVIDLTGKAILTFTNAKTINIESLPAGAYYLRLTNEEKTSLQKVIKQ